MVEVTRLTPVAKAELKQSCIAALDKEMVAAGFKFKPAKDGYYRKSSERTEIFQLIWLEKGTPGYRIQPDVGVRFEHVETIFHRTSRMEAKFQADTATIGGGLGNILTGDDRSCEFELINDSDIAPVSKGILEVFHQKAKPYFDRFGTLQAIDAELNDKPKERTPNRPLSWLRCSTGMIVARLVGRENYRELVTIYEEKMRVENKGFYLSRFQNLLKSLDDESLLG